MHKYLRHHWIVSWNACISRASDTFQFFFSINFVHGAGYTRSKYALLHIYAHVGGMFTFVVGYYAYFVYYIIDRSGMAAAAKNLLFEQRFFHRFVKIDWLLCKIFKHVAVEFLQAGFSQANLNWRRELRQLNVTSTSLMIFSQ